MGARRRARLGDDVGRARTATYLPGITLPPALTPTTDMQAAAEGAAFVVMAVPSHGLRDVARAANAHVPRACTMVSATKGLEEGSLLRMSQVLRAELPDVGEIVVLSGPSFALELARELPTAVVAAGDSPAVVEAVMAHFGSPALRLYGSADVVGVELGGALKNIIAIAAGVVEGLGLGHNALAALITRGLAELSRLAVAPGAQRDTLSGLAGLGDLVLTCTGDLSRNRRVGHRARARPVAGRDPGGHADGGRGRAHHRSRAGAWRDARHRAADRPRNVGRAGRPHRSADRHSQPDGPQTEAGTR